MDRNLMPDSMNESPPNEPSISYSIKDILGRVEGKLDAALFSISGKADHADLLKLSERVRELERVEEQRTKGLTWHAEWKRWFTGMVLTAVIVGITIYNSVR